MNKAKDLWLLLKKLDRKDAVDNNVFAKEKKLYPYFYLLNWFGDEGRELKRKTSLKTRNRIQFYHSIKDAPSFANGQIEKPISNTEVIDLFLKNLPSISRPNRNLEGEIVDLSSIDEEQFEYPVSETFAKILEKQEKISEAIEIYHKLILKMPEKKVYFASHIEFLKNKLK